jgi:hypothetical protein
MSHDNIQGSAFLVVIVNNECLACTHDALVSKSPFAGYVIDRHLVIDIDLETDPVIFPDDFKFAARPGAVEEYLAIMIPEIHWHDIRFIAIGESNMADLGPSNNIFDFRCVFYLFVLSSHNFPILLVSFFAL